MGQVIFHLHNYPQNWTKRKNEPKKPLIIIKKHFLGVEKKKRKIGEKGKKSFFGNNTQFDPSTRLFSLLSEESSILVVLFSLNRRLKKKRIIN